MTTPFNVRNEIKADNPAAGIGLAGILIALGIILMASLSGPFTGWKTIWQDFSSMRCSAWSCC